MLYIHIPFGIIFIMQCYGNKYKESLIENKKEYAASYPDLI